MKSFLNIVKLSFLIIGGVVGAGFLSGREIITFFGKGCFLLNAGFSLMLLCLLFLILGLVSKSQCTVEYEMALFERDKFNRCFLTVALTVCLVCMLSGLNALVKTLLGVDTIVFSFIVVFVCFFISKGGLNWVETVNSTLTLLTVALLFVCLLQNGRFDFYGESGIDAINPVVFSFINFYLCAPIFFKASKNKSRLEIIISVTISCIVLFLVAIFIYGSINARGLNAKYLELPIFAIIEGKSRGVIAIVMVIGILSSVIISYYSVVKTFCKKKAVIKKIVFSCLIVLLSKLSLTCVVNYFYPLIGAFGVLFFVKTCVFFVKRYKNKSKVNNIIKS